MSVSSVWLQSMTTSTGTNLCIRKPLCLLSPYFMCVSVIFFMNGFHVLTLSQEMIHAIGFTLSTLYSRLIKSLIPEDDEWYGVRLLASAIDLENVLWFPCLLDGHRCIKYRTMGFCYRSCLFILAAHLLVLLTGGERSYESATSANRIALMDAQYGINRGIA